VTVSVEEIYILLEEDNASIHVVDTSGMDIAVEGTTVDFTPEDVYVLVAPQETSLLISEIGVQGPGSEDDVAYDLEIDETSTANAVYIGQADPGTDVATAGWRIKRILESSGTHIDWADGNAGFNKVWDDRLTYVYGP
jgi:hypothetical protein